MTITSNIVSPAAIQAMLEYINSNGDALQFQRQMFDIFEGELLPYIEAALKSEISPQSYANAKPRIPPINILQRLVDKRSKIYQQHPIRKVVDGTDSDQQLVDWYVDKMQINEKLNNANELYNLSNSTLLQPFIDKGVPSIRAIPNDKFLVFSDNPVNPMEPTLVITCHGYGDKKTYHAYTDSQYIIFDSEGKIDSYAMAEVNNADGVNPYGKIPFIYVNRSNNLLVPKLDKDTMQMTILFPVLMTDLNYAVKFQSFSMVYIIDCDDKNLVSAPNAVWMLKTDPNTDKKPEIGSVKPQVDITEVIGLIKTEFALWLSTKGLKPGSIGEVDASNIASGLSKMIDEMDTSEDRQKQATKFAQSEKSLWDLILNYMHPVWSDAGMIENNARFTVGASVLVKFAEQLPMSSRGTIVRDLKEEVASGFITRAGAIKRLNPDMSDEQVNELLDEIEEERTPTKGVENGEETSQETIEGQKTSDETSQEKKVMA